MSTLGFGARVSEITLGAARRNVESGAIFEAKEAAAAQQREAQRAAREARSLPLPAPCGRSSMQPICMPRRCSA